eukprot:COSAG06_NODE_11666_length_1478_cov_1.518841_2_plen_210_part_00
MVVPQWWVELKATVSGTASAATEAVAAAGTVVGSSGGVILKHQQLRDWATQLYPHGAGKMDEDTLHAAVAWMEERGVMSQLSKGAAHFHGATGIGPYYQLQLPGSSGGAAAAAPVDQTAAATAAVHGSMMGAHAAATAGMFSALSPRLASGVSAVERAGRRAEQQIVRERVALARESRSLDRAIDDVYGGVSKRSPRWQSPSGGELGCP